MKITRKIKASTDNSKDFDVFMLMDYGAGDAGMESDTFTCLGKFFARDLTDAQNQLKQCARKYPEFADGLYVTEYNEYFDDFNEYDPYDYYSNEVFQNLEVIFKQWAKNQAEYDEYAGDDDLPYASTKINASEEFDNYEDEIQEIDQEFTSENTSINSTKLRAIFKMVSFEPGTINIDYGGGRFDNVADYLTQYDVINLVYDPYNRSKEHNSEVIQTVRSAGGADTATCSNVLNVIKEPEVRLNVLRNMKKLVKPSGNIYITVYEGSGKGDEGPTKSGYQLNRKTADYLEEIQQVFPDATRKGQLITATNSGSTVSSATLIPEDTSSLQKEIYDKVIEVMMSPDFGFDEQDAKAYSRVDVREADGATVVEIGAEVSYDGLMTILDACDAIVAKYSEDAYFEPVAPGIAEAWIYSDSVNSATYSYGGAYDLADDTFFTKEELMEWADDICDAFNKNVDSAFRVADIYTSGNNVTLEVENEDTVFVVTIHIDMRRIRSPRDIARYTDQVLQDLQLQYNDFYNDDVVSTTTIQALDDVEPTDSQETVQIVLENVIVIVNDDAVIFEDESTPWLPSDAVESDEYGIALDDIDDVPDRILDVIETYVPAQPGRYSVSGIVNLVYDLEGLEYNSDPYYTDDGDIGLSLGYSAEGADITFNYRESSVENLDVVRL